MVQIGKFDIFATYNYVKARLTGSSEVQAKEYGYMIAVMGARGKGGRGAYKAKSEGSSPNKTAPKKASVFSAADYDKLVGKMGAYYNKFLPAIEKMVKAGLSYDQVKVKIDFPKGRGTKMDGDEFLKRAARAV